jgi:GNAT superfamily N-acetyltransferase
MPAMQPQTEWRRGAYSISTDPDRLDRSAIHAFLRESYWASGIPREVVDASIRSSLPFGLYDDSGALVGFARVVTDFATFAYVGDVFVLPSHRGRGLAVWLMEVIRAHPRLQGLRRWVLATRDAHSLYRKTGFAALADPGRYMEIVDRDVYLRGR